MGRKKNRFYKNDLNSQTAKHAQPADTNMLEHGSSLSISQAQIPTSIVSLPPTLPASKSASTKREREFEKYVGKKLKKEERAHLFQRIQQLSTKVTSDALQSTKNLRMTDVRKKLKTTPFQPREEADTSVQANEDENFMSVRKIGTAFLNRMHEEDCNATTAPIQFETTSNLAELQGSSANAEPADKEFQATDSDSEIPKMSSASSTRPSFYVLVDRSKEIQEQREKLPIFRDEQTIMEAVQANPVTIICGETGSGKTTQIPQFLWEYGYGAPNGPNPGMVAVTQPRRVAAISMANRVAYELGLDGSCSNQRGLVGYQVRFDHSNCGPDTRLKFMTDGILLREISTDFLLRQYSVVILDEAHERNLNTDLLVGLLSRIVRLRQEMHLAEQQAIATSTDDGVKCYPLKLIIMSATLNVSEFTQKNLFDPIPPVISVEARQYPVAIHFARTTKPDYIDAAYRMVVKIHNNLPEGGILVFLTGKQEIAQLQKMLHKRYPTANKSKSKSFKTFAPTQGAIPEAEEEIYEQDEEIDMEDIWSKVSADADKDDCSEDSSDFDQLLTEQKPIDQFLIEQKPIDQSLTDQKLIDQSLTDQKLIDPESPDQNLTSRNSDGPFQEAKQSLLHILPLYSMMSPENQMRIFEPPPAGTRLCIIATNVAETSLTIPGIRYVVDSGMVKQKWWNPMTGAINYQVNWISKASASQRAGRAGRTGPGHCYRLYSSAVFDRQFSNYSMPEIERSPVDGFVLMVKSMGIDRVDRFPLPSSPSKAAIISAEASLVRMGALKEEVVPSIPLPLKRITMVGRLMSLFPLSPCWSRLLIVGMEKYKADGMMSFVILSLVSILSVGNPFIEHHMKEGEQEENGDAKNREDCVRRGKGQFMDKMGSSDLLVWLNAFISFHRENFSPQFCNESGLVYKKLEEMEMQFKQLKKLILLYIDDIDDSVKQRLMDNWMPARSTTATASCLSNEQRLKLCRLIGESFPDRVCERVKVTGMSKKALPAYRHVKDRQEEAGVSFSSDDSRTGPENEENIVYLHGSSSLRRIPPKYLVYNELAESVDKHTGRTVRFVKDVTAVELFWTFIR